MGMLPLAIGMAVTLTEHIDRSENKQLLRGKRGIVHSWLWPEGQARPSIVYVKFEGPEWQLEGLAEPGVYPIVPMTRSWYLDKGRKAKTLRASRTQLPLTPAYSMTAHSSQGKTLRAVLLDLHVDKRVDPTIGTVATTRVRSREDVLIMRPFPKFLFQRGLVSEGPDLLLQKLAGQDIDWAAVREAHRPCAPCRECQQITPMDAYTHEQWELIRSNKAGMCRTCKNGAPPKQKRKLDAEGLQKYKCMGCSANKIGEAFPRAQLAQEDAASLRQCLKCVQVQRREMMCCRCLHPKPRHSADAGKETPRWFLHLQNMQQSLPSQSSRGRGSLPKVPQLCFAGPQKGGRTNVSQCSVQAQVDRGNAGRWQATALLSKLPKVISEWTAKAPLCTAVQIPIGRLMSQAAHGEKLTRSLCTGLGTGKACKVILNGMFYASDDSMSLSLQVAMEDKSNSRNHEGQ